MQENKSILNQKCDHCGHKVDYFELKEHGIKENSWYTKNLMKYASPLLIISPFIFILMFLLRIDGFDIEDQKYVGLMYSFGFGFVFCQVFYLFRAYKKQKNYSGKKARKSFYHHKVRWNYYRSLSRNKRKILIFNYIKYVLILTIPYFAILISSMIIINIPSLNLEVKRIIVFIAMIIYFGLWFYQSKNKKLNLSGTKIEEQLKSCSIDYQRFNKGVKSK